MRVFQGRLGIAFALALTASAACGQDSARLEVPLVENWRFKLDDGLAGAEAPAFDDAHWQSISVPHTWNRVGYYQAGSPHLNSEQNVVRTQGVGWYRLRFAAPAAAQGRKAWLQFDAASRTAEVWLNGVRLGDHRGGFSRFRLDASAAIKTGSDNVLVVKTDNSVPAPGSTTADILPLAGDFFVHGGLYRPVSLIFTDTAHVDMLDLGGPGVYATTTSLSGNRATVSIRTRVRNDGTARQTLVVRARLLEVGGTVAATASDRVVVAGHSGTELNQALDLARARLWQGVEDPYLYTLSVEVRGTSGKLLDRLDQPYGIREMRVDPVRGFLLNGKQVPLHGVGYHQDREGKGWAVSAQDTAADMEMLREMGINTIRLTHYQHGQPIHEMANRYGMVLWDEIPLVSRWTLTPDQAAATPGLLANARQQLQELIRQNFNHPSVATWGLANEVDFGAAIPGFVATGVRGAPADPLPLLAELQRLAKSEDPSRPTALATCCEAQAHRPPGTPITAVVADLGGANRYYGWYLGKPEDLDAHLETLHANRPLQPLSVTEYGAGGATTMHTDNVLGGIIDSRGREQPEEYMSHVHERTWAILKSKSYLWATWLWNSFDFATTSRREGDSQDINTKGLITYDRSTRKDPFYFYKANWTSTPTVYITGRRYFDRAYAVTSVKVYSNAPRTELRVNGQAVGTATACPNATCEWQNVRLAAGSNSVQAIGYFAQGQTEDQISWQLGPAASDSVRIDSGALMASSTRAARFGSDDFFEGGEPRSLELAEVGARRQDVTVKGTENSDMAATYREGRFRYRIPVDNGRYRVQLTFMEPSAAPGERRFDVAANKSVALADFDIAAAAGATATAVTREFEVAVADGILELDFRPSRGAALVSGIEALRQRP